MKSLTTKLVRIMANVKRVAKNGRNDFHKYDYVTEADVLEAVREALAKENIFIYSSVVNGGKGDGDITSVLMKHTFVDGDTGEAMEVSSMGQGQDKGDKGANKAVTAAMKYMLMKNFLIPTGDDSEATDADGKSTSTSSRPAKIVSVATEATAEGGKKAYGFSNRVKAAPKTTTETSTDEL